MEEDLYERIGEADLNPTYKDGQVYQHTDINNMLSILKTAVNENYYDIQRLGNGSKIVGKANSLDGAALSRYLIETLQADDDKVPSSQQVKAYVDALFAEYSPPIRGVDYWTEEDQQQIADEVPDIVEQQIEDMGPLGFTLTGNYDDTITYHKFDVVYYQGSTYAAKRDTIGNLPTNSVYWNILAIGTLTQFTYNSVAEMKLDNSLEDGIFVGTAGYYSVNDGGNALYKVRTKTNDDVVDEMFIIGLYDNSLIAEMIIGENIAPEMIGAYGDGIHDDTDKIEHIVEKNINVYGNGIYKVDNLTIGFPILPEDNQKISNVFLNKIISTGTNAVCIQGCVNFKFNYIENTIGNGIAFVNNTYNSRIYGTRIVAKKNGIYFNTDTSTNGFRCWVQYTEFNIKQIKAEEKALYVHNTDRWFNSNRFIDCIFAGDEYGIYLDRSSTGALDENTFNGISLEGSTNGIYLNRTSRTKIESIRAQEVPNIKLKMVGTNMYCDIYIGVSTLAKIDLSEVTGGWGTLIRGVILDDDNADAIFNEIAINSTNLSAYYSLITYKLVSQLENGVIWPNQDGTVTNYCNNHTTPLGNATVKTKFAAKNIYVDSRGNAIINFNSSILQYLGVMHLFGDSQNNFTTPVKIQIDGVDIISLPKPCSFMFTKDYRKIIVF